MGKKKSSTAVSKSAAKASKKAKTAQKVERKEKKKSTKSKEYDDDDEDLEGILDKMQKEWEAAHTVTEELVEGPPSRRASATLTACPNGNHLWCIGGEFFSEDGKAYFYNDVFRYTPEKNEWRKFVSPTCPGPRSAHAVVASPAGGGKLFLFGGEFSSLHQNNFHHYRDFWEFEISSHSWDRIDTKIRPSGRSGHRMAMWKQYIVLFGGFIDPGFTTKYLNDTWIFDTQDYKWRQIEFKEMERKPSPRSGFSFLPTPDGIVLHGGYCKEYVKGKRPMGVMLEDTWFLKMTLNTSTESKDPLTLKWERRKRPSTAYAPSLRSGCTMTLWPAKNMGVLFGGVTDDDNSEETLESVFWNDLNGYQLTGNGRWVSMTLKRPKKVGTQKKKKGPSGSGPPPVQRFDEDEEDSDMDIDNNDEKWAVNHKGVSKETPPRISVDTAPDPDIDPDDPNLTIPLTRYNAMLAVLRNTVFIYGGIYERGSREYTLDDFYSLQLDKLDRYTCLKESGITIPAEGEEQSSSDDEDEDEDDSDSDSDGESMENELETNQSKHVIESELKEIVTDKELDGDPDQKIIVTEDEKAALRTQANAFMGVAKDSARSIEDVISTPLPGETLAMFYARSREYWSQKAHSVSDNRGKLLRRDGFGLAEDRYSAYKPLLAEVEKILAEAGLDEEEMKRGAAGGASGANSGQSRNRR